jgi:hypothetical protein
MCEMMAAASPLIAFFFGVLSVLSPCIHFTYQQKRADRDHLAEALIKRVIMFRHNPLKKSLLKISRS